MAITKKTSDRRTGSRTRNKNQKNGSGSNGSEPGVDVPLDKIASEEADAASSPVSYDILTYPADFTLEVLKEKWNRKEIDIPLIQRRFVWKLPQASKLIESFLLGLPVPPIFVFMRRGESKQIVVDGQQRLRSIIYFFEGNFGEEEHGKRVVFKLTGLNEESPFADKTYKDLEATDPNASARFRDAVLRSFVIKQLSPDDDTSITHIFERLNTGGTLLSPQEIRNCLYHGKFNTLLNDLNKLPDWRAIVGADKPDKRQRDVELILRFFALHYDRSEYEKPMKDFLSEFMKAHANPTDDELATFRQLFEQTTAAIIANLGAKPFRLKAGLNVAVYDCVATAFASHLSKVPRDIRGRMAALRKSKKFLSYVTAATTDEDVLAKRLKMAASKLFGQPRK